MKDGIRPGTDVIADLCRLLASPDGSSGAVFACDGDGGSAVDSVKPALDAAGAASGR
jgi:hypothetical protein